jgi:hypothetical protein
MSGEASAPIDQNCVPGCHKRRALIMTHLMFGILALTVEQLLPLAG